MRLRFNRVFLALVALSCLLLPRTTAHAQNNSLCFAQVPDCISGRFAEYWQQNGGLPVFGYPISSAANQSIGGQDVLVQTFERNRFELHAEQARPYDVQLGRLGADRLQQLGRTWESEPKAAATAQPGCAYFAQIQHLVCEPLLGYWRAHGVNLDNQAGTNASESLALFGLPLTEATSETGTDGQAYLTQWFERARFEVHRVNGANTVLLGLLGRETTAPVAPAEPTPAPTAEPPTTDPAALAGCSDAPISANGTVDPPCMLGGTAFVATGTGFNPNQAVDIDWVTPKNTDVDLGVIAGPAQALPDGTYPLKAAFNVNAPPGVYTIIMKSKTQRATIQLKIVAYPPGSPPEDHSQIPPSVDVSISQVISRRGTAISFIAEGFAPHEHVAVYGEQPGGQKIRGDFTLKADAHGVAQSGRLSFDSGDDGPIGVYSLTFEGEDNHHKAIAYFRIMP